MIRSKSSFPPVVTPDVEYLTYQQELCQGRLYWTGYVCLKRSSRGTVVKTVVGSRTTLLHAVANHDYVHNPESRVEGPWTHGFRRLGGKGARSVLDEMLKRLNQGASLREIAMDFPEGYIRNFMMIERHCQSIAVNSLVQSLQNAY